MVISRAGQPRESLWERILGGEVRCGKMMRMKMNAGEKKAEGIECHCCLRRTPRDLRKWPLRRPERVGVSHVWSDGDIVAACDEQRLIKYLFFSLLF